MTYSIGAVLSGFLTWWLAGQLARARFTWAALDHPNERSLHAKPTPRTGGVAILAGLLCGLVLTGLLGFSFNSPSSHGLFGWPVAVWIVLLAYGIGLISFLDDRGGIPVLVRLGSHLAAASILIVGMNLWIPSISIPVVGTVELGWLATPASIGFLVWMTNLYNFMDGMDGFAGGMTLIGGLCLALLMWESPAGAVGMISFLLAGAATGFLLHNFPPARIFMGDVGSIPIGFFFGAVILLGSREQVFDVWVPLIVFSPFLVDATATLCRRLFAGEKIWEAHRTHYYQRMVLLGWGHRRTVLIEYGLMVLCAGLAALYQFGADSMQLLVLCAWCMIYVGLMVGVPLAERAMAQRQLAVR